MNLAQSVIEKLGGYDIVAGITGVHVSRIYRWTYPRERGGTGGWIPQKHHRPLLDYARLNGIPLVAGDFVEPTESIGEAAAP